MNRVSIERIGLIAVFMSVFLMFREAFLVRFFADDYFFLRISQPKNFSDVLHFFYPFKGFFYRPIPTELFYSSMKLYGYNLTISHLIVFLTFFVGLSLLYFCVRDVFKNPQLAMLSTFLYAIHVSHTFQLYWHATFQEITLFTFLLASFYSYILKHKVWSSLFFLAALMSKESALMFPIILAAYEIYVRTSWRLALRRVAPFAILSIFFVFIYASNIQEVTTIETYEIMLSPKLFINNLVWYSAWSLGLPNLLYLYFPSLLSGPVPEFWSLRAYSHFDQYMIGLLIFNAGVILSALLTAWKEKSFRNLGVLLLTSGIIFTVLIGPTLLILHKWMVRLTVPLITVSILQAYFLLQLTSFKKIGQFALGAMLGLYLFWNYHGVQFNQSSSLYDQDSQISMRAEQYFALHSRKIIEKGTIFFKDPGPQNTSLWDSRRLQSNLHYDDFLYYYFPENAQDMKVLYEYETDPDLSTASMYVIDSKSLLD